MPDPAAVSLPPIGTLEADTVEFKVDIKKKAPRKTPRGEPRYDQVEIAKDVAAMANTFGGTIYVGAVADGLVLKGWAPLDEARATELEKAVGQAISNRCNPIPPVQPLLVSHGVGYVLVISVLPYPAASVGVLRRGDEHAEDEDSQQSSFMFPVRRGAQTHYLEPGHLSLIQIPEFRKAAVMLKLIPQPSGSTVQDLGGHNWNCRKFATDFDANSVTFSLQTPMGAVADVAVPLTRVTAVWRNAAGYWVVAVEGTIRESSGQFHYGP